MAARLAPRSLPPLAEDGKPGLGTAAGSRPSTTRPRPITPRRSRGPEIARRGRSRTAEDLREARHSAARARGAGRRRGRRRVRQRLGRDHLQGASSRELGIIFCSFGEAVREHPDLVRKYLGSVVPQGDNFFAALNSAVFSDGSFAYVPPGVRCPMELSTYFRINAAKSGQFERTLIIADKGAYVSYLEGCTAPQRDENQLHAAVVELVALEDAADQILDGAELVSGRRRGEGRHLQFRDQARRLPRRTREDFVDPGRDRLGHHLEISELPPRRRRFGRRVLFGRHHQQSTSRPIPAPR